MRKIVILFIIFFTFTNLFLYSQIPSEELTIKLINSNRYIINYYLTINIDNNILLQICYEPSHLKKYLNKIVKLKVINSQKNSQIIAYEINFLFLYNFSVYERKLNQEENKIDFELIYFNQNVKFIPKILELNGYYKIIKDEKNDKVKLNYFQLTKINSEISNKDLIKAKRQIKIYFNNLKIYLKKYQRK